MSGQKKWPSHPGYKAVDNTAFSGNANVAKVRKGMDGYTASLILEAAKEDIGAWADLYKAMNQKHTPKNDVERAHVVYEQLWYKVWAIVENPKSHALGVVAGLNTNTGGFYPWDRYPIYVKLGFHTYEYTIFSQHYGDVKDYIHNPKKILKDYASDLQWKIVPDTTLSPEQRQQYIIKQQELAQYNFEQQKKFFETTKKVDFKKNDKIYIYDYLESRFKNNRLFSSFSENNLADYTAFMLEHKIADSDLSIWIEERYIELLKVDSWYNAVDLGKPKDYVLFGVKTSQIVHIYNQLDTLGVKYIDLKNKIWQILQERINAIQWEQLYDFVAEVAWTPYKEIAMVKLEKQIQ